MNSRGILSLTTLDLTYHSLNTQLKLSLTLFILEILGFLFCYFHFYFFLIFKIFILYWSIAD